MPTKEKRNIAIVSGKGGVGKTTLAINLGYLLQKEIGINTTTVDCNLTTPHLGLNLGLDYNLTLNHVLADKAKIEEAVIEHPTGIKVLPASLELNDLEEVDIFRLPEKLDELNSNILIDSAPGLGREGVAAMSAADEILFITQPNASAVVDIYRCKEIAEKLNKKILGIVVNYRRGYKHELSNKEIEKFTEIPVMETVPYDIEIEKSSATNLPLPLYNQRAKANDGFYSLASQISGYEIERRKSFFDRIIGLFKRRNSDLS